MLHLFKKVYVATDDYIDVALDRVVISKEHGHDLLESFRAAMPGTLIAYGLEVKNLIGSKNLPFTDTVDMFDKLGDHSDTTGKRIIIYCDQEAFMKVMALWFKMVFKKTNKAAAVDLLESMVFKHKLFGQGRFTSNNGNTDTNKDLDIKGFGKIFEGAHKPTAARRKKFLDENKASLSLEYLLATYLANGKTKKELKTVLRILLKKDLEKYLFELKEIFLVHILTKRFMDTLDLEKSYDFTNYDEIQKDKSEFPSLFFDKNIWNHVGMSSASSGKNINFHSITEKHKKSFAKFTKLSGACWNEEGVYEFIKSDISKLDFIACISDKEMTDKQLDMIIKTEASYEHAAGSFFSIDLETVNHYFVQALLDGNKEFREQYAIM